MVNFTILAGGYTTFFTLFTFQSSPTPTLTVEGTFPAGTNPSWLSLSPVDPTVLYATNELEPTGGLLTFKLDKSGVPTNVATVSSNGADPAFGGSLGTQKEALVINYSSGNGQFFPLSDDLLHFGTPQNITFPPPANGVSHPHHFIMRGDEILLSDLGADKVWRISKINGTFTITGFLPQPTGSGPRRSALSLTDPNTLFILHELDNTLSQQTIPASRSSTSAPIITTLKTTYLPNINTTATNGSYHAAELLVPPLSSQFPHELLYVSNRDTNVPDPQGDTIAIFATNPLRFIKEVHTGLNQIRGMEFGGPNNEFLIAAGLTGGGTAVFERVSGGQDLKPLVRNTDTAAQDRSSFVWL